MYQIVEVLSGAVMMIPEAAVEIVTHIVLTEAREQTSSDTLDGTKRGVEKVETSTSLWDCELDQM
jgi:hypothetical protein